MNNIGPNGKVLSLLSLCRKAAKLSMGFDKVLETVADKSAGGVFLTGDLSEKTGKEVAFACAKQGIQVWKLPVTMDEVKTVAGKRSGVISITDKGLADKMGSLLEPENRPD